MKKILLLSALSALITTSAHASVVKLFDAENRCDLYQVIQSDSKIDGQLKTAEVVYAKDVYGLSFLDMEINFDTREVLVQPIMNIVMGFNRPLIPSKAIISADNQDFKFLINQLNRKVFLFEKICISDKTIVYAKMFPPSTEE